MISSKNIKCREWFDLFGKVLLATLLSWFLYHASSLFIFGYLLQKQGQIVLERSARLNLDLKIWRKKNKTQCQLCKRLAGPFIPLSWYCLVWKRVSLWMWPRGGSQQPFSCVLGHFPHGDKQTNERTNNQMILVQACSWPVWDRQSFAMTNCQKFWHLELRTQWD